MRGYFGLMIVGVLAIGLTGCDNKDLGEFEGPEIKQLRVTGSVGTIKDITTGRDMPVGVSTGTNMPDVSVVAGGDGYKNSQFQSSSVTATVHRSPGFRGADADYIDKADVYWKLNWIRKQLQSGKLPSNLKDAVKKTRKVLMTVVRDRNFTTADQAVTALEEGIEHMEAQETLKLGNVNTHLIPWGAGREAVARYFDKDKTDRPNSNKYLHRSGGTLSLDSTDDLLTSQYNRLRSHRVVIPGVKEAQALAISYAEKHRASPEEMMRRAWSQAILKTNQLRDDLGLMNRADNSDRNDVSVPTVFGTSSEPEMKTIEPDSPSDDVVPIPSITGSARRTDVPVSTFKEPSNPFANP